MGSPISGCNLNSMHRTTEENLATPVAVLRWGWSEQNNPAASSSIKKGQKKTALKADLAGENPSLLPGHLKRAASCILKGESQCLGPNTGHNFLTEPGQYDFTMKKQQAEGGGLRPKPTGKHNRGGVILFHSLVVPGKKQETKKTESRD